MRITINRDAVCSADDQVGPLDIDIAPDESIEKLVEKIVESRFLQFSSSHHSIVGCSGKVPVVEVHDDFFSNGQKNYFFDKNLTINSVVRDGCLDFRFKKLF
ncbi:hypothetical protein OL229_15560 [Neisseriaceae bacterium JH1-16]|nr:hypothetical protein [Neisseriaceae bacterium JH1-16]